MSHQSQAVGTSEKRKRCINPQSLEATKLDDALLQISTIKHQTGLSAATIYRKVKAGEFPQPVRLSARCSRWRAAEVRAWICSQTGA